MLADDSLLARYAHCLDKHVCRSCGCDACLEFVEVERCERVAERERRDAARQARIDDDARVMDSKQLARLRKGLKGLSYGDAKRMLDVLFFASEDVR